MKKAKLFTTALTLGLLISPLLSASASTFPQPVYNNKGQVIGTTKVAPIKAPIIPAAEINLPAVNSILEITEADVTGDGITDTIYLAGHKVQPNSQYVDDVSITVKSGARKTLSTFRLNKIGGYQPHLFIGDFSGDKVPDVYVATASGGSGGWSYYNIVSFNDNKPKQIFTTQDNPNQSINGRFIDGWKTELTNSTNGKTVAIDVSARKSDYLRLGIYNEDGTVKRETQTLTAPYSKLEPIDVDNDGVFELKGVQRISGAYRADGIADIETMLKYDGTTWSSQSVKLTVSMGITNAITSKPTSLPAQIITSENKLPETEND